MLSLTKTGLTWASNIIMAITDCSHWVNENLWEHSDFSTKRREWKKKGKCLFHRGKAANKCERNYIIKNSPSCNPQCKILFREELTGW